MKILLLGSNGQVGQAFESLSQSECWPIGWQLVSWNRAEGDLSKPDELIQKIEKLKPDAILNAAAYTQVDKAESEAELCKTVNTQAPERLAKYCALQKIPFVHYSTDYVYEGTGTNPHLENEQYRPQNVYGLTKAQGDEAIHRSECEHLIFRTSWVYSHTGKNFVLTMLKLGSEREELKVVNDQVGSPSYAPDLAKYSLDALMKALETKAGGKRFPSGIYHLCNSGYTNWAEFASEIFKDARAGGAKLVIKEVQGIATQAYPTPAKRPLNSRLSLNKFQQTFHTEIRPWNEALAEAVGKILKGNQK